MINITMRLNELEFKKDLNKDDANIEQVLQKYGWKVLGHGLGGAVAEHPQEKYVLKIFSEDDGYTQYVEFIKQNQGNMHLPKINAYTRKIPGTRFNYIRMEKLSKMPEGQLGEKFFPEIAYFVVMAAKNDILMTDEIEESIFKKLKESGVEFDVLRHIKFGDMWEKLGRKPDVDWINIIPKLVYFVDDNLEIGYLDIHSGNFMLRGSTLVITDPV